MPMTTRSRAVTHKSEPGVLKATSEFSPCESASFQDSASASGALAPALSSTSHTRVHDLPILPDESPKSASQGAQVPFSTPMPRSVSSIAPRESHSRSSVSSANTVKAQQLAAKVEHARRLAAIEAEREKAAAERERLASEREKALAELELQAELAAIACSSSRSSKADYVTNWLVASHVSSPVVSEQSNPVCLFDREIGHDEGFTDAPRVLRPSSLTVATATADLGDALSPPTCGLNTAQPIPKPRLEAYPRGEERPVDSPYKNTTTHAPMLGTHNCRENCNLYRNKSHDKTVGTQDQFILLANAIADLGKNKIRVSDIPRFDGRALDWLPFKRAFEQSKSSFSPCANIARISGALHGMAREAVAVLLVTAEDPEPIMKALETRFAQPEFIVLQQLALVRSLPRLGAYEAVRELNIFACRIRNCVEVIRFLNQPEYLAAPELVNTIVSKLTPLLRSRWVDFAAANFRPGIYKLQILADFLEIEANLQIKFGLIPTDLQLVTKSQAVVKSSVRDKVYAISSAKSQTTQPPCQYCQTRNHGISSCKEFLSLDIDGRWQWVIDNKVCRRCLKKGSHQYRTCKKMCEVAGCTYNRRHHTALHRDTTVTTTYGNVQSLPSTPIITEIQSATEVPCTSFEPNTSGKTQSATVAHSSLPLNIIGLKPLLKVIAVTISGPQGSVDSYALLDDGSSVTLLDQSVADLVGAKGPRCRLNIDCIGGLNKQTEISYVNIKVKGQHSTETHEIRARSISNLGVNSQSARFGEVAQYTYLSDLAEVLCYDQAKPMLLIGADNWQLTIPRAVRQGTRNQPAAALTSLGWVLLGYLPHSFDTRYAVNHIDTAGNDASSLTEIVKDYFKLDSIGIMKIDHHSASENRALKILEETTKSLDSGRYETGLLWRENISFVPGSRELALSRFTSLERKMVKDDAYAKAYKQNIDSMINKGYAELCTGPPSSGQILWYLPHFGVVHPHKKKLRVVHDAAAECAGVSLNSLLLAGPDLLQSLVAILMRFREGKIAVTGDIREMFPQVKIRPEDRDAQRFLWRNSSELPIQEFRMSSMIFGAVSSPFTALWIKNKNATQFQEKYPDAVRSIIEDHYMDDFLGSFDSTEEAARRVGEIFSIHKAACFEMRSWVSSHKVALALIPSDLHLTDTTEVVLGSRSPSQIRVLGLTWSVTEDKLYPIKSLPTLPVKLSKRSVLSLLMSIYDPLGFLIPIIVRGRVLFQKTWKIGTDWDHNLPANLALCWKTWYDEILNLMNVSIPRCHISGSSRVKNVQLHVFADASERAYACVAYWRFTFVDDSVSLSLIGAKGRLAPLKPVSIPRLELQAALIAARFGIYITGAHRRKPSQVFYWSDSLTVLKWLRSDACTFKAFVSFRVGEIVETTDVSDWRYVPTALNVADDATRDNSFSISSRWFSGPSFLLLPQSDWPREPECNVPPVSEELKRDSVSVGHITTRQLHNLPSPVVADHQRFSKWIRLLRATARIQCSVRAFRSLLNQNSKFSHTTLRDSRKLPLLSVEDLHLAEVHLFRKIQLDSFADELTRVHAARPVSNDSRLKNLSLLFGDDNLLRLSGRTAASDAVEVNPIILDGTHRITRLLIHSYHERFAHGSNESVVNELRQKYYILGLRPAVRGTSQRCQVCRIRKTKPVCPPVGDLPDARLAHHQRPFSHVGLDYFGPLTVTICRRTAKRWIALFTCMTIRAVHLEVVENLSASSAMMALRRFIARRGCPIRIYSDNGTSFVGAAKMFPELYEYCSNRKIEWRFIPPSAPFMGGCWERLVRSVKNAMSVTLKERSPKEEVLHTLLLEAECIINSRPLTHVSVDVDADNAITPFTFLIGTSSNDLPIREFDDADLHRRVDWRKAQRLADHFWQRFVKEYLPSLVPRKRVPQTAEPPKIGDLVFIADGSLPRSCWPRGRIAATYPGKDGIVRVVDVATKGGVLRRPIRKIAMLVTGQ